MGLGLVLGRHRPCNHDRRREPIPDHHQGETLDLYRDLGQRSSELCLGQKTKLKKCYAAEIAKAKAEADAEAEREAQAAARRKAEAEARVTLLEDEKARMVVSEIERGEEREKQLEAVRLEREVEKQERERERQIERKEREAFEGQMRELRAELESAHGNIARLEEELNARATRSDAGADAEPSAVRGGDLAVDAASRGEARFARSEELQAGNPAAANRHLIWLAAPQAAGIA